MMKKIILNKINLIIASLLTLLGFSTCEPLLMYGDPPVEWTDSIGNTITMYGVPQTEFVEDEEGEEQETVNETDANQTETDQE